MEDVRSAVAIFLPTMSLKGDIDRLLQQLEFIHIAGSDRETPNPEALSQPSICHTCPAETFSRRARLHFDSVRFNLVIKRLTTDTQALCGLELIAASFFEHLNDGIALDSFKQSE